MKATTRDFLKRHGGKFFLFGGAAVYFVCAGHAVPCSTCGLITGVSIPPTMVFAQTAKCSQATEWNSGTVTAFHR